jgi:hypothetical protein
MLAAVDEKARRLRDARVQLALAMAPFKTIDHEAGAPLAWLLVLRHSAGPAQSRHARGGPLIRYHRPLTGR